MNTADSCTIPRDWTGRHTTIDSYNVQQNTKERGRGAWECGEISPDNHFLLIKWPSEGSIKSIWRDKHRKNTGWRMGTKKLFQGLFSDQSSTN